MSVTCLNIIKDLNTSVDNINYRLVDNMTDQDMKYGWVCIKPNSSYEFYYEELRKEWEHIINHFINQPKCTTGLSELIEIYRYVTPERITKAREILNVLTADEENGLKMSSVNIDDIVLEVVANSIINTQQEHTFNLEHDFYNSMVSLGQIMTENCQCQIIDIFKTLIKKYKKKYHKKFEGKTKNETIDTLREDYQNFKKILQKFDINKSQTFKSNIMDNMANKLTGIYGFSVEKELDKLIPNELGSLKEFFIKVISKYYNNLHPIVWAQIFKNITEHLFIDLPFTPNEIFSFVSKYLLLNSGPFILKILQMIRPILSPELATKYNLTKLTYPVLKPNEVELILGKVVNQWNMYRVLENFSASVGHVCKVVKVDNPENVFIIKIIKPLAVAQSCWEYKTLYDLFPEGTCEQTFIKNMLESNGRELNVNNEISNINRGHEYYTATYRDIFSVDIDAKLTAIKNIPEIIKPDCWFALTMDLAPGMPLSKLVEGDLIKEDTKYRAKLHRCLDILVYKFFHNLVKNGFYHGDLHAGNIFFSYDNNQMTLIDFGAVGEINIYSDDQNVRTLLDIIVMSTFYNYDEMLDTMTVLLNSKCIETQIDMSSLEYAELKQELINHKINNIKNQEMEKEKANKYKTDIFGEKRIQDEKTNLPEIKPSTFDVNNIKSIYSYLEYQPKGKETVVENKDVLPQFTEVVGDSKNIGFAGVLEKIIKFYALSGVNIAIKFNEFYELQKAYALLLGVLHKVGYNSYRTGIAIHKAIISWNNITDLRHVSSISHVIKTYQDQKGKYDKLEEETVRNRPTLTSMSRTISANNELILNTIKHDINVIEEYGEMTGGNSNFYYKKYLKYKTKYNQLTSN